MPKTLSTLPPSILAESPAARIALADAVGRLSLRAGGDLGPLNTALGLTLPTQIGRRAETGGIQALCLGPDEWILQGPQAEIAQLTAAAAAVYSTLPHSLVDVSGREITFVIDGPRAADLLTIGMARDVDSVPIGEGRRTNFDGTLIVLWREGVQAFRIDVWHSFAPHLLDLLATGCRELAAEPASG